MATSPWCLLTHHRGDTITAKWGQQTDPHWLELWGSFAVAGMDLGLDTDFVEPVAGCGDRCHHGYLVAWAPHPHSWFSVFLFGRTRPALLALRAQLWFSEDPGPCTRPGPAEPLIGGSRHPPGSLLRLLALLTSPEPACFCFLFLRLHK